jgi:hypothetical protein
MIGGSDPGGTLRDHQLIAETPPGFAAWFREQQSKRKNASVPLTVSWRRIPQSRSFAASTQMSNPESRVRPQCTKSVCQRFRKTAVVNAVCQIPEWS